MCGSVTSSNLVELATGSGNGDRVPQQVREGFLNSEDGLSTLQSAFQETSNPHIEFFDSSTHGYNLMEVTRDRLVCTMIAVSTTQQERSDRYVLARFEVPDGLVQIRRTDVVPTP